MTYTTLTERRLTTARAVAHSAARRIVASLTLTDPERAAAVGAALLRGGVTTVEVPLAALPGATRVAALADTFPDVDFIPAGAIAPEHLRAYPKRATVVSSALVRPADPRVETAARRALRLAA